jgi:hypothetical protein
MALTCPGGIPVASVPLCQGLVGVVWHEAGIEERGVDCNATGVCDGRRGKRCKLEGEI